MPRKARIIVEGMPHHIIQRGTRKQKVFFKAHDHKIYLAILGALTRKYHVAIWAYCLMSNHVHLIVVPETKEGLAKAMGEIHKMYADIINKRENWTGHLWEGRYKSFIMSESHIYKAIRYVENNPVRANLVRYAQDYPWSSAKAHVERKRDPLLAHFYLMDQIADWKDYLKQNDSKDIKEIRVRIRNGLPWGGSKFISLLEERYGQILRGKKPGRPCIKVNNFLISDRHQ